MKVLIFSDVHGNREALDAVLDAPNLSCDRYVCLGDITGYGPEPAYCIDRLRSLAAVSIIGGNHDAAAAGQLDIRWFSASARASVLKDRARLSPAALNWLSALPVSLKPAAGVLAVHGSPAEPLTEYLWGGDETMRAFMNLRRSKSKLCFIGHTHETAVFVCAAGSEKIHTGYPLSGEAVYTAASEAFTICNPGSVGFPRVFNSERVPGGVSGYGEITESSYPAFYAIWDTETGKIVFDEARYDRRITYEKLRAQES